VGDDINTLVGGEVVFSHELFDGPLQVLRHLFDGVPTGKTDRDARGPPHPAEVVLHWEEIAPVAGKPVDEDDQAVAFVSDDTGRSTIGSEECQCQQRSFS